MKARHTPDGLPAAALDALEWLRHARDVDLPGRLAAVKGMSGQHQVIVEARRRLRRCIAALERQLEPHLPFEVDSGPDGDEPVPGGETR